MKFQALATSLLLLAAPAFAGNVTIAHGIPGGDLGQESALPVDICDLSGSPVLAGVEFQQSASVTLPPGSYDLAIRLADKTNPCQGDLAVPVSFSLALAENVVILAHLSEQGTPTFSKFVNDLQPLAADRGRVVVRHAASAPPVNVVLRGRSLRLIRDLRNPDQSVATDVKVGNYAVTVFSAEGGRRVLGPASITVAPAQALFIHAVGSARTGSLTVIPVVIPVP